MKKSRFSNVIHFAVLILVLGLIAVSFILFSDGNKNRIINQNIQYISDNTAQIARKLDLETENRLNSLVSLAKSSDKSLVLSSDLNFDSLEFADLNGTLHDSNGNSADIRGKQYFADGLSGKAGVVSEFTDNSEAILKFYAPINNNGEISGVLVGSCSAKNLFSSLIDIVMFKQNTQIILLDETGRVIVSNPAYDPSMELTYAFFTNNNHEAEETIRHALIAGETEDFTIDSSLCSIRKLHNGNIYIMAIMPDSFTTEMVNEANQSGMRLTLAMLGILIFVASCMIAFFKAQQNKLEDVNSELSSYKTAVLADALITFEANITENTVISGLWRGLNGKIFNCNEILEIDDNPMQYDEYIQKSVEKFVPKDSRDEVIRLNSRSNLMEAMAQGKSNVFFDYTAIAFDGSNIFMRCNFFLTHNKNGDVIAYCCIKDATKQRKKDEQLIRYEKVLATVASHMYKGLRVVDLDDFNCTYLTFENGAVNEQDIGSWTTWLSHQRGNVNSADYENLLTICSEKALLEMEAGTSITANFRNSRPVDDENYRAYQVTIFKEESLGKAYAYFVVTLFAE